MDIRPSWASSPSSRVAMQANRRRDTIPEIAVRRLVHAAGLRYRVDAKPLAALNRRADLVFPRVKVAVFVDGCYWHGCPAHLRLPASNAEYWSAKILGNMARDSDTTLQLRGQGWTVCRFWEHEQASEVAEVVIGTVRRALEAVQ